MFSWAAWRKADKVREQKEIQAEWKTIQGFFVFKSANIMNIQSIDFPADWSTVDHCGWPWEFSNFEHTQEFGRFSCAVICSGRCSRMSSIINGHLRNPDFPAFCGSKITRQCLAAVMGPGAWSRCIPSKWSVHQDVSRDQEWLCVLEQSGWAEILPKRWQHVWTPRCSEFWQVDWIIESLGRPDSDKKHITSQEVWQVFWCPTCFSFLVFHMHKPII